MSSELTEMTFLSSTWNWTNIAENCPDNSMLHFVIVSFWENMRVFCQFPTKTLQNTRKTKNGHFWFIFMCKTVFCNICQISRVGRKKSVFFNSELILEIATMIKKQNILAMNYQMWLILKFKTIFNRIRPVSLWFEGKHSFPSNSLILSEIVSFWNEMRVFISICENASKHQKN